METNQNKPLQILETDDPLDIRKDIVFKAVFTRETSKARQALSRLVSALIGKTVLIEAIWANEPPVENIGDGQTRFDINCRAEDGERINVEMSFDPKPYEPVRLELYTSRLYSGQDIKGRKKNYYDLKRTYQIAILSKKRFFDDDEFLHTFEYYDPVCRMPLKGKTRIITLELVKVKRFSGKTAVEMSAPELWAYYFQYLTDKSKRDKINKIAEQEQGITMANEVLLTISRDEIERSRLLSQEKYILDRQSEMVYERRRGIKIGKKRGEVIGEERGLKRGKVIGEERGIKKGIAKGEQKIIELLKSGKSAEEIIREYGG